MIKNTKLRFLLFFKAYKSALINLLLKINTKLINNNLIKKVMSRIWKGHYNLTYSSKRLNFRVFFIQNVTTNHY